ncbi:GNAT family N-acyltransferase [Cribrihabitans pelagius]|uniref:GNAT family N-acyltransferase n=1 Tax=Cribrihabitans pelagius TaxID=1765746 RepID=UPI003B5A5613
MADPAMLLEKGRLRARLACGAADLAAAEALRLRCFGSRAAGLDRYDEICSHVLIEDLDGRLLCCFRLLLLESGAGVARSYSAQNYDLGALQGYAAPMAEIGRFCIDPAQRDADILRLAWGALALLVDRAGAGLLFGCASFAGTDPAEYSAAFAWLRRRHLAPPRWRPGEKAAELHHFAAAAGAGPDTAEALRRLPPLLRSYLAMGGWVSDHAVVDRQMNTLHVFTGLEIAAIPAARKRLLRAAAG